MRAIGRQSLKTLRAKARFQGTLVDLAQHIETDSDLVSALRLRPGVWILRASQFPFTQRRAGQHWAAACPGQPAELS